MSVTSGRSVTLSWTGDVEYSQSFSAADVSTGSGQSQLITLSAGNNTITVPTNAVAATITFSADNAVQVKLKGVAGDTGIQLNLTDPTSIGLNAVTSFVLNATDVVAVRILYS